MAVQSNAGLGKSVAIRTLDKLRELRLRFNEIINASITHLPYSYNDIKHGRTCFLNGSYHI